MLNRTITISVTILCVAFAMTTALAAQDAPTAADLDRRVRELEQRVQQMQTTAPAPAVAEIQRQIEILTQEIEALKTRQGEKPAAADVQQSGLGAAASKVYRAQQGVSFGGYGEFLYQNFDSSTRADTADALRAILYTGYKFNDRVLLNSEVEYEHANTEKNGEVEVEFAYLDYQLRPSLGIRTGLLLMPVGIMNEQHEPTAFLSTRRNQVETRIIPTTWSELGAGVVGEAGSLSWRGYLTTSLNSDAFSATGIRSGRQMGSQAKANDFAVVGRLDWQPLQGTIVGGSLYNGNAGQDRAYDARVTLGEIHGQARIRGINLQALFARGSIGDAAAVNARNSLAGSASVGERFGGWYAEAGYDLATLLPRGEMSLTPFARYEQLDTQRRVPAGFSRNRANDQSIVTVGVAFKPIQQTVIKADYQNIDNEAGTGINQWNLAVGYIF